MILNVPAPPSSRQVARCPLPLLSVIGSLSTESCPLGPMVIVTTASGFANPFAVPVSSAMLPPSRRIMFPAVKPANADVRLQRAPCLPGPVRSQPALRVHDQVRVQRRVTLDRHEVLKRLLARGVSTRAQVLCTGLVVNPAVERRLRSEHDGERLAVRAFPGGRLVEIRVHVKIPGCDLQVLLRG